MKKRGIANCRKDVRLAVATLGGRAAQKSPLVHLLTFEERSRGGKQSPGKFANRPHKEVVQIAKKGGSAKKKYES